MIEEKSKKNNIRKGIIIGCGISALLLAGFLGSYAFFISSGTNNPENISTQTGTLALIFADGNAAITESLEFGGRVEKTFTIENTGTLEGVAKINFEDLVNTYIEGSLTYTLSYSETENGDYSEVVSSENVPRSESSSTQALADNLVIPAETKYFYKLVITLNYLEDIDQTEDLNAIFSTHFKLEEGTKVLTSKDILTKLNVTVKDGQPNFAEPATTDETANGLYSLEDDYGTSYYFRGAVENNYVKFAEFYWRIIRINGDGSLRMIYDGKQAYPNGETSIDRFALQNISWNTNRDDAKYVGYMYGPTGTASSTSREKAQENLESSNIKQNLENWYITKIKEKNLDKYVADSIFCNDRSFENRNTGTGFGMSTTYYGARGRTGSNTGPVEPKLICPQKNDAFTVSDIEKGNGALNEKIGLITADEIILAGSGKQSSKNNYYYLKKGFRYWSISPYYFDFTTKHSRVLEVSSDGGISYYSVTGNEGHMAPVISLTPEYVKTLIGDGTMNNPYRSPNENL